MAFVTLVGRVLLAAIFILSGLHKLSGFSGTVGFMTQHQVPMATLLAAAAIVVEVGGGLGVLLGLRGRAAALALALFLVPTTLIFHSNLVIAHDQDQSINFLKNLAIIGGLLILAAQGPGSVSFDARRRGNRLGLEL